MEGLSVKKLADKMGLRSLLTDLNLEDYAINQTEVNRPALQLTGYFEYFDPSRVEIIGTVEYTYLQQLSEEERRNIYGQLLSYPIPCIIFCREYQPEASFLEIAGKQGVPVLGTDRDTSEFMADLIHILNHELAPCKSIHGVLVDVYGEGLLIMGESGIGKSEAALELIRRGHRLVTDDVVELHKVNNHTLMGRSPNITRNFIELRGIGILDVKTLYGVECVKEEQRVDLIIKLEEWKKEKEYDRLGMEEQYMEYLGVKVACHYLPIRPGRNLAVICEAAAVNHRQKKMGYNAAHELYRRVQENMEQSFGGTQKES